MRAEHEPKVYRQGNIYWRISKNGANFTTEDYSPKCVQTWGMFFGLEGLDLQSLFFWPGPELPSRFSCMEITCLLNCSWPFKVSLQWNCGEIEKLFWKANTLREYFSDFTDITNYVELDSEKCWLRTEQIQGEQQKRSSWLWERKWKIFGGCPHLKNLEEIEREQMVWSRKGLFDPRSSKSMIWMSQSYSCWESSGAH